MSKVVTIPTSMNPFVVIINGVKHEYAAGETVEVPDNVAGVIEQYEKGSFPKPAAVATVIEMVSPGGKVFEVTVSDFGQLLVKEKPKAGLISFYIDGEKYTAEEGMTWRQWIESEYGPTVDCLQCEEVTRRYLIDGDYIQASIGGQACPNCDPGPNLALMDDEGNPQEQHPDDVIVPGLTYTTA